MRRAAGAQPESYMPELTHLDDTGAARMVDIGAKGSTERVAVAAAVVSMRPQTLALLEQGGHKKGDVLAVARIAGIQGAKEASRLIPLCHPLPLTRVAVELSVFAAEGRVEIEATAETIARTGVEMEALAAVSAAGLALYDMLKGIDRAMVLGDVRVVHKAGGKSGATYADPLARPDEGTASAP